MAFDVEFTISYEGSAAEEHEMGLPALAERRRAVSIGHAADLERLPPEQRPGELRLQQIGGDHHDSLRFCAVLIRHVGALASSDPLLLLGVARANLSKKRHGSGPLTAAVRSVSCPT